MLGKLSKAVLLALVLSLALAGVAYAEGDSPRPGVRAIGEVTKVVPGRGTFSIVNRNGEELTFQTTEETRWRSRDGSVQGTHALKTGRWAFGA
jgi:hypothetical protein